MSEFFSWIWTLILDLGTGIKEFFGNLVEDFRESNRYFKIKVGLIVLYVCTGVATAAVFIPPGPLNEIGARVRMSKSFMGGRYVSVTNESSDTWKEIVVTLNGRYKSRYPILRPGKKKAFRFDKFADDAGEPPQGDLRVMKLRVDCSEGAFEHDYLKGD
ncbi:MAG: hypothetical protein JXR96_25410 [Deltaproteobacteria bacterium]|nr:hypothetical protein [Deltaproteobacteria bacterium]